MEDGTNAIAKANLKSKTEPLLPPEVERDDMSSTTWRLNVLDFPALPPRMDGDHSSFNLRRLLRTPSKPSSQIFMYVCMILLTLCAIRYLLFLFLLRVFNGHGISI
ncbi:hypothetical protein CMV_018021 [Castanea mollissima]|uniref:Uncharacterized protein n=1 Tax=Castanea mollissima TaxID=60419 RepID=A0A8J4VQ12_9ROSI|nr:hypothetical protein CMV_018021 [Castanea mollissima]